MHTKFFKYLQSLHKKVEPPSKSKKFNDLPSTLHRKVDMFLNSRDSASFAGISKSFHALSDQAPLPLSLRKLLKQFLGHVVHGDRDQMQEMLQNNIRLLILRDSVTDYSGREFPLISSFEYVLWALDSHQWDDMLACLPRDKDDHLTEAGREIVQELLRQYAKVRAEGVTYMVHRIAKIETHYDFAIIEELEDHVEARDAVNHQDDWEAVTKQWCEDVGGEQRLLPMHVVDEYISNKPFYPIPQFDSRPTPSNMFQDAPRRAQFRQAWFAVDSKIGVDRAIYKGRFADLHVAGFTPANTEDDVDAMKALRETKILAFGKLETQLESLSQLVVEEQPRPGM